MKKFLIKTLDLLKLKKVYIPLIVIILIIIGYKSFSSNTSGETIITLEPKTFVQEVSVTGKVQASQNVDMGFETSGRVARVNVKVSDIVKKGTVLASLANGDSYGTVLQRQADLETQQANYDALIRGSRPEDVAIAEADFQSAQALFDQNSQALVDKIKEAYSVADDAVRTKADQFYTNPRSTNPEVIPFNDNYLDSTSQKTALNAERLKVGENLQKWNTEISSLTVSQLASNYSYIQNARNSLAVVRTMFDDLSSVASYIQVNSVTTQAAIDALKSSVSTARSSISTISSGLTLAEQNYNTSKSGMERAKQQLALKKAGSTEEDLAAGLARVKSAQAQLESANGILAKTLIVAPFDGVVTKMDAKVGESTVLGTTYVSMISASNYEVESYVSESDIAKVKVGQPARITLDTYGKDVIFPATVYEVDPAETVVDGVTTYKIKLSFNQTDERIKSGMTSNITIETSNKPSTFVIPQEALFLIAGEKMVTVDQGGKRINKKVETGGLNASGEIEIVSGLLSGERVVVKNK